MLEYNRDQIIGEHISIIVPDMFVVQLHHLATDKTAIFKGSSIELETRALSGTLISTELTVSMWRDHNQTRYGIILRDVTERQRYEERLFLQAHRDPLTGLANRTLLTSTLDQVLKNGEPAAIMIIDLDGFKDINDSLGHASGDEILSSVARRLQDNAHSGDLVARMGGRRVRDIVAKPE
ncbi:hypothetical protein DZS_01440 [Dickeya ananatis]